MHQSPLEATDSFHPRAVASRFRRISSGEKLRKWKIGITFAVRKRETLFPCFCIMMCQLIEYALFLCHNTCV